MMTKVYSIRVFCWDGEDGYSQTLSTVFANVVHAQDYADRLYDLGNKYTAFYREMYEGTLNDAHPVAKVAKRKLSWGLLPHIDRITVVEHEVCKYPSMRTLNYS